MPSGGELPRESNSESMYGKKIYDTNNVVMKLHNEYRSNSISSGGKLPRESHSEHMYGAIKRHNSEGQMQITEGLADRTNPN